MAFRDDTDALHARIESLERELADARLELDRLRPIERERDRLQRELDALRPKKKPKPDTRSSTAAVPAMRALRTPERGPMLALVGAGAILVIGLVGWLVASTSAPSGGSTDATPKPPDNRPPSIGVIDLDATPDPVPISFAVTGTLEAPPGCRGYLPDAPQLVLRAAQPMLTTITTRCGVDLVAVLGGAPAGLLCDDDGGEGTQPRIQTVLGPGDARLTIGTYSSGTAASCEIELHAIPLPPGVDANGLAHAATPGLGVAALSGAPAQELGFDGTLGVTLVDASRLQSGCVGLLAPVPDVVLEVTEPTIARIETVSNGDLVLVMQNADGTYTCDDDDGMGNAPRIAKRLAPGRYPVWVGPFSEGSSGATFHVGVRLATIASEVAVAPASVDLVDGTPLEVTGVEGDELSVSSMWSECAAPGYVRYEPERTFQLAARRDVTIRAAAGGQAAPLLVVQPHERTAGRALPACSVDGRWRATLDAGSYDVWVGVASGDVLAGPYSLTVDAAAPSVLPYTP